MITGSIRGSLTLLQFSPQAEEMERFAEEVIPLLCGENKECELRLAPRARG